MNIYATGSFCNTYKCAGIGIHSDSQFESNALRIDYMEHAKSSNLSDATALRECLMLVKFFTKKTLKKYPRIYINISDIAVVNRFIREINLMYQSNYRRDSPWDSISQLLRELQELGLLKRVRVIHCGRDEPIMKLAIKQAKDNLKVVRKYIIDKYKYEESESSQE